MGRLKYLLDTNILSEPLATQPRTAVLNQIARYTTQLAISAITWQEMLFGMYRLPMSKRRQQIEHYLEQRIRGVLPILPFDQRAADWQAQERARLIGQGRTPPYEDSQIAAIAVVNSLTLVTRNTGDFSNFAGLIIENWFTESE